MYAEQIVEWGRPLERREYANPEPKGTEVLLKVGACGVCHSDLHIHDGFFDFGGGQKMHMADRGVHPPLTLGHEIAGEVVAVGPEVRNVRPGERYILFPWIGCGECDICREGFENLCTVRPRVPGTRVDGGYASHVVCPHPRYLVSHEGIPAELACIYACSGITAYSALRKVVAFGDAPALLLIGAGGVGRNALHIAPGVFKGPVVVADTDPAKREAALAAGAAAVVDNGKADAVQAALEATGGGAVAAIDFVGRPETVQFGIDAVRKGGRVIVVGLYGDAMQLSTARLPLTALTLQGSYVGTLAEMKELMALVSAGKVAPIHYRTRPLAEANEALTDLRAGTVDGRTVLVP